jgi:hypothetical protein
MRILAHRIREGENATKCIWKPRKVNDIMEHLRWHVNSVDFPLGLKA